MDEKGRMAGIGSGIRSDAGVTTGAGVHKISMVARRKAAMNGVVDVLSFDDREIVLDTTEGMLVIRGEGLHVNRLTVEKGEVDIEGRILSLNYSEKGSARESGESFWGRLFR